MWVIGLILVLVGSLCGQSYRHLLLPKTKTISAIVVDQDAAPIEGAEIGHHAFQPVPRRGTVVRTDTQGFFLVTTNAPLIVVRKPGYASAVLRTQNVISGKPKRIVLRKTKRTLDLCSQTGPFESLQGWGSLFGFVPNPGIRAGKQGQDIDYGIRVYFLKKSKGRVEIVHGSGPMWSFGLPEDEDVWKSVIFEEDYVEFGGSGIVDSRGKWADGSHWRMLGRFGETVNYKVAGGQSPAILDEFMDNACLAPPR